MLESFNPKESAFLAWFIITFIFIIAYSPARKRTLPFLKTLFAWKLSVVYLSALAYFCGCLALLYNLGIWEFSLSKDALFWFLFSGTVMMFNIAKDKKPIVFFETTLKSLLKITVFLEFIIGLSTFSFWIEFALIPTVVIIAGMYAVSTTKPEYAKVNNILKQLLSWSSIAIFLYILAKVVLHYSDYLKAEVAIQFSLPIFFTVLFIPLLAGLSLYVHYEQSSKVIKRHIKPQLYRYATARALVYFNFNIQGLLRWRRHIAVNRVHSKDEISATMRDIRQLQRIELKPPPVSELDGWSPYVAKDFLKGLGIETGDYWPDLGDEWQAISNYQKLGDDFMDGDCSYYIFGTRYVAKKLKLNLRIFDSSLKSDAKEKFLLRCNHLYSKALNKPLPKALIEAIKKNNTISYQNNSSTITVEKDQWLNEKKGYDLMFIIEHGKYR
ncbi:hypothetical protein [Pedobacter arcticus]|uniref:hypothetical protein n=1 Tax=Pedobacter arcticus TaxID=752140 RepID=UPI0002F55B53|nr:hypothetical protein [Pedobacter arcticus]